MKTSQVMLFKQIAPESSKPWRLVEVYYSVDGPRTRVCDGVWASAEEALEEMKQRINDA